MKKISISIVDDHKMIREMWAKLFSGSADMEVVGECGGFDEAIEMIRNKRPDIVLLDINLSQASGLDAVPLIRKYSPGSRIIAVSMYSQPAFAKKMFRLGAGAYVTKNSSHLEMLKAIGEVMNGKNYVCNEIKDIISEQAIAGMENARGLNDLSLREIEIIRYIKEGLSSKEIATKLHLSTRTVEVHRHNILKKLKLKNTATLINFINNTDLSLS